MEISQARFAADQVLLEECQRPTIGYEDVANEWVQHYKAPSSEEIAVWQKITRMPRKTLSAQRKDTVRDVTEMPHIFRFGGTNYDLLMSVYSQVPEYQRPALVEYILSRVDQGGTYATSGPEGHLFPSFMGRVCELPLIAEFCVRNGYGEQLFAATAKAEAPTIPLAIMMIQLEETVALQWNLFSSEQLGHVYGWLKPLREMADKQTNSARGSRTGQMVQNPDYKPGREREANHIVDSIDRIAGYSERGRFFYLKGTLQQNTNVEVENDKSRVENFLQQLGFSKDLEQALLEADVDFRDSASAFELKNCLTHLRGFLEHLHLEAARHIAKTTPGSTHDWDTSTTFLRKHDYITEQQEKFVRGLYTLISDHGVHPLVAHRLFARVLRNFIIEYGFLFLTVMDRKGVRLA